jgi:hypothetical protein
MESDSLGNVFIGTTFQNTISTGTSTFTSFGSNDILIAKLYPNGTEEWARQFGNARANSLSDIAVDGRGNVHLTGFCQGDTNFFGNITHLTSQPWHFYLARLNSAGVTQWVTAGSPPNSSIRFTDGIAVEIASQEKIYVIGEQLPCTGGPCGENFLAKFDTLGVQYFHKSGPSTYYGGLGRFKLDRSDNIFTVRYDRYTGAYIKYDKDLNYKWALPTNLVYGCWDQGTFEVDKDGNSYRAGRIMWTDPIYPGCSDTAKVVWFGNNRFVVNGNAQYGADILYTIYDSTGKMTFVKAIGGNNSEGFTSIHHSKTNDLYYNGGFNYSYNNNYLTDTLVLGTHTLQNVSPFQQFFIAKIGSFDLVGLKNVTAEKDLAIYPNPVNDLVHVKSDEGTVSSCQVFDLLGNELISTRINGTENPRSVDVSTLSPGTYLLKITSGGTTTCKKLIKN